MLMHNLVMGIMGVELTELSTEQADYINVPKQGPFKPESYCY
jgi:adenosylhomocysteinase